MEDRKHIQIPLTAVSLIFLVLAAPASAQKVVATVPVGKDPTGLAVDPVTQRIFVASFSTGAITVIDVRSNPPATATVPVGAVLTGVAVNAQDRRGYVADGAMGRVTVFDLDTGKAVARVNAGAEPYGLLVDPATKA